MDDVHLSRVEVSQLFGYINYTLPPSDSNEAELGNVALLYGDNGCGKTTLLRLIYATLTLHIEKSSFWELYNIPFLRFSIALSNGYSIIVSRKYCSAGFFTSAIRRKRALLASCEFSSELANSTYSETVSHSLYKYRDVASNLRLLVLFIPESRDVLSSKLFVTDGSSGTWSEPHIATSADFVSKESNLHSNAFEYFDDADSDTKSARDMVFYLKKSRRQLLEWANNKRREADKRGEYSSHQIYASIIETLGRTKHSGAEFEDLRAALVDRIVTTSTQMREFAKFGLLEEIEQDRLIRLLYAVPDDRVGSVFDVLVPYLDGLDARLTELMPLQQDLSLFRETCQSFLENKEIEFAMHTGLIVSSADGGTLRTRDLSSGEKQILFLLIQLILTDGYSSIILIDEPELSLNVKWQRAFLPTIRRISSARSLQTIIATHSIEILAKGRDALIHLEAPHAHIKKKTRTLRAKL